MARAGFLSLDRISHRAALGGRVVDALSKLPLSGAEVRITNGPAAWKARVTALAAGARVVDRSTTDSDGFFRYLDLPTGSYELSARLGGTRYAPVTSTVAVGTKPAALDLALAPTALAGVVNAQLPAGPLPMARVRFVDSGELVYTDANGTFTLSPLEPGTNRTFEVSAQRYVTAVQTVTLLAGKTTTAPLITLIQT